MKIAREGKGDIRITCNTSRLVVVRGLEVKDVIKKTEIDLE